MGTRESSWMVLKPPDKRWRNGDWEKSTPAVRSPPRVVPDLSFTKTRLCRYGANVCRFGDGCRFAHSDEELRAAREEARLASPNGAAPLSPRTPKPNTAHLLKAAKKSQKIHNLYDAFRVNADDFLPTLKQKFHALQNGNCQPSPQAMAHPYFNELMNWTIPESQLIPKLPTPYSRVDHNNLLMISTLDELHFLKRVLNGGPMFAVDVEHHSFRSYRGFICLLQISTRDTDFIIDPFDLWHEMHILNEPFTNPNILKVFHGAHYDVTWLQRDFGIYVVNMFDTQEAMRLLDFPKLGLNYLVEQYCNLSLEKQFQRADWRYRPLTEFHIDYARKDTHYLLYCYDVLRNALIGKGDGYLDEAYNESRKTCLLQYHTPQFEPDGYQRILRNNKNLTLNNRQIRVLERLWVWRDEKAREFDECVEYVMSKADMLKTVDVMPATFEEVRALYGTGQHGHILMANLQTILEIVNEALSLPLEEPEAVVEDVHIVEDVHSVESIEVAKSGEKDELVSIGCVSVCIVIFIAVVLRILLLV
uniref:HRDC domain-containing protein n=1 Tax=Steinernema glaseri TaxID=37863 RepID=A0A1I7YFD0_9BILA